MAKNDVPSNILTYATIETFNNKQSNILTGFREMLDIWDFSDIKYFFKGIDSPSNDPIIKNEEIDIVGFDKDKKAAVLIVVKANSKDKLLPSQNNTGKYITYAIEKKIPLYYFVPKDYVDKSKLPPNGEYCHILYWDKIEEMASTYDITFANLIIKLVQNVKDDTNIALERFRTRIWEILARTNSTLKSDKTITNLTLNFGKAYIENPPSDNFHDYIYLNENTFLWFDEDGVYLGKNGSLKRNKLKNLNLINAGFKYDDDKNSLCYYHENKIISIDDFMNTDLTDKTVDDISIAIKDYLNIENK